MNNNNNETLDEAQKAAELFYSDNIATIEQYQQNYESAHNGRYFQGLRTHSKNTPAGNGSPPDHARNGNKPTDQMEPWFDLPNVMKTALIINTHTTKNGGGYQVVLSIYWRGNEYARGYGHGFDAELYNYDWVAVSAARNLGDE